MNNSKLLDMFLWFPRNYRKRDMVHRELVRRSNNKIDGLENVYNPDAGTKRIFLEHAYYRYSTLFKNR